MNGAAAACTSLLLLAAACVPARHPPVKPPLSAPTSPPHELGLGALGPGDRARGFVAGAVYVDAAGRPRGARFVHERTRFVFDYLAIESAPQAFVYATTYPESDGGAPHTQEHLLLGKGNKGRWLGNYDHVTLGRSSAATGQFRTWYHFHTSAEGDAFWGLLGTHLDALLSPDYSDEEIRREVRNFGVARRPDGVLELEEKGTVYNEMVRTYESPGTLAWDALGRMIYGEHHPLALSAGGTPEGIRELTPEDIRRFHHAHYQLANMGMVGAFPTSIALPDVLANVGKVLDALAPTQPDTTRYLTPADLPEPRGAPSGALSVVDYPAASAGQPSPAMLAWPATRHLDLTERTVLELFLATFAGGESSTMYDALIDRTTRSLDVGATSVWMDASADLGQPLFLGVESIAAAHADEASLRAIRDLVLAKLDAVAGLADGSPALAAFGDRMKARIVDARRRLDKALDTPPGFGDRGTSDFWVRHLAELNEPNEHAAFQKDLTLKAALDLALALASSSANPWRQRIATWGLLEPPYGVIGHASPALRKTLDAQRDGRVAGELSRLEAAYGTKDAAEALRRREAELATATEELARAEATVPMPPFVTNPPMTLDDSLLYKEGALGGVPVLTATFDAMKSVTVGLALRVDGVSEADLPYLAVLPAMLREVGVVQGDVPLPYDAMNDRLRREVLDLSVRYSTSFTTGRVELAFSGSGGDVLETRRAIVWMSGVLARADWRPSNLPRIRDVVERYATGWRDAMSGPEEHWARGMADAYRRQDSLVLLHTASTLTRAHDALRLSWMLEGVDPAVSKLLIALGHAGKAHDRARLVELAKALSLVDGAGEASRGAGGHAAPPAVKPWLALVHEAHELPPSGRRRVARAGRELLQLVVDFPDRTLAEDWASLCGTMADGLTHDPKDALAGLRRVLAAISHTGNARAWVVGSARSGEAIATDVAGFLGALDASAAPRLELRRGTPLTDRARAHSGQDVVDPRIVALVNSSTANGAIVSSTPVAGYDERSDAGLVDFLAANVFSGQGTHSFYKRIWGAALAYSGFSRVSPEEGRMELYSDRCADLPQLLRFVDGEVRRAPADPRFVDYAVANTFYSRVADTYESRAAAMATNLADGVTPERVRGFRARLLEVRSRENLSDAVHARLQSVYAGVVPSLSDRTTPLAPGALWFAIAPEAQVTRYEAELRAARGPSLSVLRLYPRDFWL